MNRNDAYVMYVVAHDSMRDEYLVIQHIGYDGPITVVGHFADLADAEADKARWTEMEEATAA